MRAYQLAGAGKAQNMAFLVQGLKEQQAIQEYLGFRDASSGESESELEDEAPLEDVDLNSSNHNAYSIKEPPLEQLNATYWQFLELRDSLTVDTQLNGLALFTN